MCIGVGARWCYYAELKGAARARCFAPSRLVRKKLRVLGLGALPRTRMIYRFGAWGRTFCPCGAMGGTLWG